MNKLTAVKSPFYLNELLSPINQPNNDVGAVEDREQMPLILGWLGHMTQRSYNAWLARGGAEGSVE